MRSFYLHWNRMLKKHYRVIGNQLEIDTSSYFDRQLPKCNRYVYDNFKLLIICLKSIESTRFQIFREDHEKTGFFFVDQIENIRSRSVSLSNQNLLNMHNNFFYSKNLLSIKFWIRYITGKMFCFFFFYSFFFVLCLENKKSHRKFSSRSNQIQTEQIQNNHHHFIPVDCVH